MPARTARRWYAVASHGKGPGGGRGNGHPALFWYEPGVWVGFARDARRFQTREAA